MSKTEISHEPNRKSDKALLDAAKWAYASAMDAALATGADIDAKDQDGLTAAMWAAIALSRREEAAIAEACGSMTHNPVADRPKIRV